MPANITLITLCVADIAKATRFYETLGFVKSNRASQDDVSFLRAESCSRCGAGRRANASALWTGNGGIVAQNVASEAEADAVMATAEAAGARILKPAAKTFWGGYNAYFADPDGNLWEVAFNPHWGLEEDGRIKLPE
jgi:uncharacterized protein